MANEEQLALLKKDVPAWNQWRQENPSIEIDLRDTNLREANLSGAHLSGANLSKVDLGEADLMGADLSAANLTEAVLDLVDLRAANLGKADLRGADLSLAILIFTNLIGAKLGEATLGDTTFVGEYLGETLGLERVKHWAPSRISTDMLEKSKGQIPDVFLRGCGLPDWEIESAKLYNPDLSNEEIVKIQYRIYDLRATQAIQINPLFISYSHDDSAFVDTVDRALTKKGVRFWRDIHDLKAGRIETQVDRAIRQNPILLLVLSEHSLKSDWVEHEVREARQLEKDLGRDVLCPVALDETWKSDKFPERIMEQIKEYNILDFSHWTDKSIFDNKFAKLLTGLDLFYKKPAA
jgi:hypothetical protein